MNQRNWFKASTPSERSGDILVSFDARWRAPLIEHPISSVLRRRVPKSFAPRRMYLYVGSPHSHILGHADVKDVSSLSLQEGLRALPTTGVTESELRAYFTGYPNIGCYLIGPVVTFARPLSRQELHAQSGFSPPQSFVALSFRASEWLAQHALSVPPRGGASSVPRNTKRSAR